MFTYIKTSLTPATRWRTSFVAATCALALLLGPAMTVAEEAAQQPAGNTQTAPADKPAGAPGMAGCPYSENGACCGTCQEKAKQGQPAEHAAGDCPCKRAKEARKGS